MKASASSFSASTLESHLAATFSRVCGCSLRVLLHLQCCPCFLCGLSLLIPPQEALLLSPNTFLSPPPFHHFRENLLFLRPILLDL